MFTFLMVAYCCPLSSIAQNCLSHIDKSTGNTIKTGTVNMVSDSMTYAPVFTFHKSVDSATIGFSFMTHMQSSNLVLGHMSLAFKFVNGIVKTFNSSTDSKVIALSNITSLVFTSRATNDDFTYFESNKVVEITFSIGQNENTNRTFNIDGDIGRKITLSLTCLINGAV